jgi:hypothetical protein
VINHKTAIFRQINQDKKAAHHDALEFPNGQIVLLTFLEKGQQATVLQLPAGAAGSKVAPEPAHVKPLSPTQSLRQLASACESCRSTLPR